MRSIDELLANCTTRNAGRITGYSTHHLRAAIEARDAEVRAEAIESAAKVCNAARLCGCGSRVRSLAEKSKP